MNNVPMVSVIMPIYNMEKYLQESLESVLNQSFRDLEVICVNDGSRDRSAVILEEYASKDSRVRVINKKNTGYGHSMNVGIEQAMGKYISIVEPDDFIRSDMYSDLVPLAEKYTVDFIKSDFSLLEGSVGQYSFRSVRIYNDDALYGKILSQEEKKTLFKGWLATVTCLYNRAFIQTNHIRYNETPGASYQDTGFWFQTMVLAGRIYMHAKPYYCYRQDNPDSSMQSKEKVDCLVHEYDFILKKLKERNMLSEYMPEYIMCRFAGQRDTLARIADEHKREYLRGIAEEFKKFAAQGMLDRSAMEDNDKQILAAVMDDYEAYYEKITQAPRYLNEITEPYNEIYIYGAGRRGEAIYKSMFDVDKKRVIGFVVTKTGGKNLRLLGRPVLSIDSIGKDTRAVFIIGVTSRYADEIKKELSRRGIESVLEIPEETIP